MSGRATSTSPREVGGPGLLWLAVPPYDRTGHRMMARLKSVDCC